MPPSPRPSPSRSSPSPPAGRWRSAGYAGCRVASPPAGGMAPGPGAPPGLGVVRGLGGVISGSATGRHPWPRVPVGGLPPPAGALGRMGSGLPATGTWSSQQPRRRGALKLGEQAAAPLPECGAVPLGTAALPGAGEQRSGSVPVHAAIGTLRYASRPRQWEERKRTSAAPYRRNQYGTLPRGAF